MGIFHALYNVQLSDEYENVLKDMCCTDAYMIIGMEDQYVSNWHNNETCWDGGYEHSVAMVMSYSVA